MWEVVGVWECAVGCRGRGGGWLPVETMAL